MRDRRGTVAGRFATIVGRAAGPGVVCRQGYSSSLAAASLREIGPHRATDLIGVQAWRAAGLPVTAGPADVRD